MTIKRREPGRLTRLVTGVAVLGLGVALLGVSYAFLREEGPSPFLLLMPIFGVLAIGMSLAIFGVRLPIGQGGPTYVVDVIGPDNTLWTAFRRPLGKWLGQVLAGLGATAIGLAALIAGVQGAGVPILLIGAFFSVLLVPATAVGLWRLWREPYSLMIGAAGLRVPSVGLVPWSEIETIRVEDAASMSGEGPAVNQSLRLGIGLRPDTTVRGRALLDGFYLAFGSGLMGMHAIGVMEQELPVPLEDVIARIERYQPVDPTFREGSNATPSDRGDA
jgi:hypothetical protein